MGADVVRAFLTFFSSEHKVSGSMHRVALLAIRFLYQRALGVDLPQLDGALVRALYLNRHVSQPQ